MPTLVSGPAAAPALPVRLANRYICSKLFGMKQAFGIALLLLLAATIPERAQLLPPPSATDTTSHTNEGGPVQYRMGTLTLVDGTSITGYMPCNLAATAASFCISCPRSALMPSCVIPIRLPSPKSSS